MKKGYLYNLGKRADKGIGRIKYFEQKTGVWELGKKPNGKPVRLIR